MRPHPRCAARQRASVRHHESATPAAPDRQPLPARHARPGRLARALAAGARGTGQYLGQTASGAPLRAPAVRPRALATAVWLPGFRAGKSGAFDRQPAPGTDGHRLHSAADGAGLRHSGDPGRRLCRRRHHRLPLRQCPALCRRPCALPALQPAPGAGLVRQAAAMATAAWPESGQRAAGHPIGGVHLKPAQRPHSRPARLPENGHGHAARHLATHAGRNGKTG